MPIILHMPGNVDLFFGHNSFTVLSYSSSPHRFHEFQRVLCQPTRATIRLLRYRRRRHIIPIPLANASHSCSLTRHWLHPATSAACCSDDYCDGCDGQHCGRRGRLARVVNRAAQCGALRVSSQWWSADMNSIFILFSYYYDLRTAISGTKIVFWCLTGGQSTSSRPKFSRLLSTPSFCAFLFPSITVLFT
jgi:hypothetical protein